MFKITEGWSGRQSNESIMLEVITIKYKGCGDRALCKAVQRQNA